MVDSAFVKNIRTFAFRGQTVTVNTKTITQDSSGRPVAISTTPNREIPAYVSIVTEEQYRERKYGDIRPGDAIGRFEPGTVVINDYISYERGGTTYNFRVYEKYSSPVTHTHEVVLERFKMKRVDNI